MGPEITGGKQGGRFQRGKSGNPVGRPKGARHKATVAAETLLVGGSESPTRCCSEMVKEGGAAAMRLVMDPCCASRTAASLRDAPLRSLSDISQAHARIVDGLANGDIMPTETRAFAA